MRKLWKLSGHLVDGDVQSRRRCFLMMNMVLSGLAGLVVWLVVRLYALDSLDWLACFVGFPAMLHGLIGGCIYLMNAVSKD